MITEGTTLSRESRDNIQEEMLEQIANKVCPKIMIPVHTENAEWFCKYKLSVSVREDSEIVL